MLEQITPLVLTYNEAANIGRTLEGLTWARDIVVVDSFSDDDTLEIASSFSQVRVFQRAFDCHRNQWEFGLRETGITTPWVLALDADYTVTADFNNELKCLKPEADTAGYRAKFVYCVHGRKLHSGVYPPVTVLYRREAASYVQDGHTQRVVVEGRVEELHSPLLHDDRKSLRRWLHSQTRYAELEAQKLLSAHRKAANAFSVDIRGGPMIPGLKQPWAKIRERFQRLHTSPDVTRSSLNLADGLRLWAKIRERFQRLHTSPDVTRSSLNLANRLRLWAKIRQRFQRSEQRLHSSSERVQRLHTSPDVTRSSLNLADRLRMWLVVLPPATFVYCLILRGGIFDGWAGFYYAFQRALAELMLSLYLIDSRCTSSASTRITAMLQRPSSKTAD